MQDGGSSTYEWTLRDAECQGDAKATCVFDIKLLDNLKYVNACVQAENLGGFGEFACSNITVPSQAVHLWRTTAPVLLGIARSRPSDTDSYVAYYRLPKTIR